MRAFIYATACAISFLFFAASIPVAAVIGNSAGLVMLFIAGCAGLVVLVIAHIADNERRAAMAYLDRCVASRHIRTHA